MSRPENGTRLLPLALTALLLGGCATPDGAEAPPASVELRGHLMLGPQERAFRPCNSADSLWLLGSVGIRPQGGAAMLANRISTGCFFTTLRTEHN